MQLTVLVSRPYYHLHCCHRQGALLEQRVAATNVRLLALLQLLMLLLQPQQSDVAGATVAVTKGGAGLVIRSRIMSDRRSWPRSALGVPPWETLWQPPLLGLQSICVAGWLLLLSASLTQWPSR